MVGVFAETQKDDRVRQGLLPLTLLLLDAGSGIYGMITLRELHRILLVLVILRQQRIKPHFQLRHALLIKDVPLDLAAHDVRPYVILLQEGQPHLLQYELDLLPLGYAPVRFHVNLLQNVRRADRVPRALLQDGDRARQPRPLGLEVHLAVGDVAQLLHEGVPRLGVGRLVIPSPVRHRKGRESVAVGVDDPRQAFRHEGGDGLGFLGSARGQRLERREQRLVIARLVAQVEARLAYPHEGGRVVSHAASFFEGGEEGQCVLEGGGGAARGGGDELLGLGDFCGGLRGEIDAVFELAARGLAG
mmetsp:Transcript_22226/g.53851  ORF Transcript_22226/g.53851 Transcript_22226/m.53851 type:complete len:303 (-) Transcript_22226:140-1048(-)